jgi:DNA processing protein
MEDDRIYTIAFSAYPQIGPARFSLLTSYFKTVKRAYEATREELHSLHLSETVLGEFLSFRSHFNIDAYIKHLKTAGVFILTKHDTHYPKLLLEISDAPIALYGKGNLDVLHDETSKRIAVVGSRHMTQYGREMTERLVTGLVQNGVTIISGLAYGVDACAHRQTVSLHGKTIAVLGSGVDVISPSGNARIYSDILSSGGTIVSEYPLGFAATKWSFPLRNRIISGLSHGVLVTEGDERSGSLITARRAGEQGRDVFAVPGAVTNPLSRGPAKLLKDGAILVERVEDILDALGVSQTFGKKSKNIVHIGQTQDECAILTVLSKSGRMYIDSIAREAKLETTVVSRTCSVLEVRGIVKDYGGNVYGLPESY